MQTVRRTSLRGIALFLLSLFIISGHTIVRSAFPSDFTVNDNPVTLVAEDVAYSTVQKAKVWWWYIEPCLPTDLSGEGLTRVEEISRIATTGGIIRTVFAHDVSSPYCGDWSRELLSNVTVDDHDLYWMSNERNGLSKLAVEANVGEESTLVYSGQATADEVEERGDSVYLMDDLYGIVSVNKTTGVGTNIFTASELGGSAKHLQISDEYVFWNQGGNLKIGDTAGFGRYTIASGVTGYVSENSLCEPGGLCHTTEYVFVAQGEQIRRYDVDTSAFSAVLYDSPVTGSRVVEITVDDDYIYFFERRTAGCDLFCSYNYGLYRVSHTGGTASLLYYIPSETIDSAQQFDLKLGGPGNNYLFWNDQGALRRLPRYASAIPSVDVFITDIEVTQAIQDMDNSIQLVRDKRTGVRVHVDAAGQNIEGIAARLYRIDSQGSIIDSHIIYPSGGTNYLTVQDNPDRANFNHAFYFELPSEWIDGSTLRLRAEINPNKIPPEPNYTNNIQDTATFTLRTSPTLRTHLLVWGYTDPNTDIYYQPDTWQDVNQARSWIRRVYPLASTTGGYESDEPGLRLKIRTINDPNLGGHVERTSDFCMDIPDEDREFCAATYTNNCAQWLRATEGIPANEMIYSMIWEEPTLPFPRGFATGNVSSGPTGTGTWGWDNDGSYGDWYMGHEVGHNVGRDHPSQGNSCGHSASDPGFPYANAAIGTGSMWGFDVGDMGLNSSLPPRVYPNTQWRDMMSYCDRQWISDYTYEGIYDFLTIVQAAPEVALKPVQAGTDYIALFGTIYDNSDTAVFQVVGLWDSPGPYRPPVGGAYRMRFLDGGGNELAAYDFDGDANDANPSNYGFAVVVSFPLGTAEVELVRVSDSLVLGTHTLSSNAPTIGNVELVGATNPVTGTVTLQWQASDADGDPLHFDVYYTDDNAATSTAYALALTTTRVQLDTNQMGGSDSARFRVTVNDGTRMAEAESATFSMSNKPPSITILTPRDGLEVTYGTAVNFIAEVEDLQWDVPNGDITWLLNGASTGISGPNYTAYLLPVGTSEVSVAATNLVRQTTVRSVTVVVNDNLGYPGPTLAIGPDQVGWQVETDEMIPQQRTLTITNVGTGSLNWTATEEVEWLNLSAVRGSTPSIITLTVYPALIPKNVPTSTFVTIDGDNGQTYQLPISLVAGSSWFHSFAVYLPLVTQN